MVPVSFTPDCLLNCDIIKSPIVAVNGKINPIMINIIELVSFEKKSKLNKTKLMMTEIINPPVKPSQDLYGDIYGIILCFPYLVPIK